MPGARKCAICGLGLETVRSPLFHAYMSTEVIHYLGGQGESAQEVGQYATQEESVHKTRKKMKKKRLKIQLNAISRVLVEHENFPSSV